MEEIDIKQLIRVVGKKKKICVVIIALSIIIGMVYTFFIVKPQYTSNSKVIISSSDASIKEFIKISKIYEECRQRINNDKITASYIKENLTVSFDNSTKIINISVTTDNKEISNNIAKTYSEVLKENLEKVYEIKNYNVIEEPKEAPYESNANHKSD